MHLFSTLVIYTTQFEKHHNTDVNRKYMHINVSSIYSMDRVEENDVYFMAQFKKKYSLI